ncbi:MAG: hypothetical protein IT267_04715 [Saprospiraceae bacterium]|nr:hypothetical protein [Saprospiraceae bacterium]HRO09404.1 hypothetical protein [Saprospiraceae bacterium]HRP42694.1 hypothetical protein [Saprospiraceae bacterium]
MRNFKLLMAFAIFSITSFAIYSCAKENDSKQNLQTVNTEVEIRIGTEPCEGVGGNCTGQFATFFETVTLPQYPNCTFEIEYKMRSCVINGQLKFDLQMVEWGPWPACQDFDDDLDSVIINNPGGVALWLQNIEKKIMTALVTKLSPNYTIPNCGSVNNVTFGFSHGSCIKFCLVKKISTKPGGLTIWKAIQIPCGEACCRTEYKVCKNPDGALNIQVQAFSIQTVPGSCESQVPDIPCPKGTYYSTSCIPNCQAL